MMSIRTQVRNSWTSQLCLRLVLLSLVFGVVVGCAPQGTQPVALPTPTLPADATPVEVTLPSGWETYTNDEQCGYAISHPAGMDGTSQAMHSWTLTHTITEPSGPDPNFVYVAVIPGDFQDGAGVIYNYDPTETETLLNMPIGESRSFRDDPNLAPWFTFTRLPDTTISNQASQTYENTQPWEFPLGTKEIRYYLQANGCTYMIGGYMATVGSGEPRAISQELFDEINATFQVNT